MKNGTLKPTEAPKRWVIACGMDVDGLEIEVSTKYLPEKCILCFEKY